ncbi:Nitrilase/cyanide hydratase and apolipoprotein N-acyltransferase [Thioalkalivibrio sp. K90mix]|uniref:carbon-nitrogen hydrolase n=1 Tax=Thioalkalivibrio sp. (strain K90mix) TaxID=396595 RepID=UPI000195A4EB|nr:carbon-nitrogen hydrolase [Thioalkalivibrio sp. K90mix]ADC71705.1 Nitrilase/cyanide hydratase and apolipoprotein N-acyltransferase [Thioalkalivibrio sp. K90mix]
MTTDTLPVALIQHRDAGSVAANLDATAQAVADAATGGARLVVLAELHTGPYFCQTEDPDVFDRAEPIPGPSTKRLGQIARDNGVVLVTSLFERRAAGVYHNTAIVFEADGHPAGLYRKMHIPDDPGYYEKYYFTPGDTGFAPIDTSVGRLGVLVCWDQWYPEAARIMALSGAQCLIYPTAIGWDPRDEADEQTRQREAWITVQRGHAVANNLPVLACNRTGHEADPSETSPGAQFWGTSFVVGPQGEFLAQASEGQPEILRATLDLGRTETVRRMWPFLRDRRIDAYGPILKRYIDRAD